MPSNSFQAWGAGRSAALDEIEEAHQSVGGTGPGRRVATQQINQAYAVVLSSQFQGFCRDLHTECIEHFVRGVALASAQLVLYDEFLLNRRLDRGNPNPGNIGADFNRLGVNFWPLVVADDARNEQRRVLLEE